METSDRELLEYAAKAAGLNKICFGGDYHQGANGLFVPLTGGRVMVWNPLKSDGDAFKLMVKLALSVYPPEYDDPTAVIRDYKWKLHITEVCKDEDYDKATRRAIVRAAAEIGAL